MTELIFRGRDRYRPSWGHFAGLCAVLAVQMAVAAYKLGPVGFCWVLGVTVALIGLGLLLAFRSWTTVGAGGITVCWGIGSGRTYPWHEIRWIDVRETRSQYGTSLVPRMFLVSGRRRALPGLHHSELYPAPDFAVEFRRIVAWWELSTDESARVRPPKGLRDRLTPAVIAVVGTVLITVVGGLVLVVLAN
ncbi:hypothetical protein AB0D08_36245 [Kitasatospora sp. NPDC048540]|uniref:hypothetical protein n=1 Tax=unclassified Kitasatospora TaxID=2633591 RepID=UPI000539FD19|nr:hypothetical protein [Kitasatospora sp. MBT63]